MKFYNNYLGPFENYFREKNIKNISEQAEIGKDVKIVENSSKGIKTYSGNGTTGISERKT